MIGGYLSLLYSISDKPLEYWSKQSQSGHIRKILDADLLENVCRLIWGVKPILNSNLMRLKWIYRYPKQVIEIQDLEQANVHISPSILCPSDSSKCLNIELPILVLVIKNMNSLCRFQIQVVDTQNCPHHFQFSTANFTKHGHNRDVICRIKVELEAGWNKVELDLSNLTEAAFKTRYKATQRLEIYSNCRLRRIYFIDKHYDDYEICPKLYQAFLDQYMLKWGIHLVERWTQTNDTKSKSKVGDDHLKLSPGHLSGKNPEATSKKLITYKDRSRIINENFLKDVQSKVDLLINNFFDRQNTLLPHTLHFKQRTEIKPYVIQRIKANPRRPVTTDNNSTDAFEKINILKAFTNTYKPTEENQEEKRIKTEEDPWKIRYFPKLGNSTNNTNLTNLSVLKKSLLDRKPKSAFFLSEIKNDNEREKTLDSIRKYMKSINRGENEEDVN